MNAQERRRLDTLRADRDTITRAAEWLRTSPDRSHLAGLNQGAYAAGMAELLDALAAQLDQNPRLREHAVRVCRNLLGDRMDEPRTRRTRRR